MSIIEQESRSLPCLEERLQGPARRGLIDCYSRAAHAAYYAQELGKIHRSTDAGALYAITLLNNLGEMTLWYQESDKMRTIQQRIAAGDNRGIVSKEALGATFEELSMQLSHVWHLPQMLQDAQSSANSHLPIPLSVTLASTIARESSLGWYRDDTLKNIELLAEFLEIPIDRSFAEIHTMAANAARYLSLLPLPLPAFFIICQPRHPEPSVAKKSATNSSRPQQTAKGQAPLPRHKTPTSQKPARAPSPKHTNPLQVQINEALNQMHHEVGLSRTMFAMLTPDKTSLKSRLVTESEQQLSLKNFALNIEKPSLFSLLMKKPQAVSLNKENAEQYLPMLPSTALEQINTSGFIAMSVFIQNKPIGLFYADNGMSGPGVTRQQFENFKAICMKVMKTIR
jgi:hypothetical protein